MSDRELGPDDPEWHERRRQGIGASEVAAVLGRHPYASPWSIWARKVGLVPAPEPGDESEAQWLGRALEPIIAARFAEETGLVVAGEQMMLSRPGMPWARATVDGLVFDRGGPIDEHGVIDGYGVDDALGVLELKFTSEPPWSELPEHHALQVQWQLYVVGLGRGWLAAMHLAFGRPRFRLYEVERDERLLAEIVPEVERFWFDNCLSSEPPPVDGSDATTEALKAVFGEPVSDAGSVELDDEALGSLEVLRQAKAEAKVLAGVIAEAENVLRATLGDASEGRVGGFLAVSWRLQHRREHVVPASSSRVLRLHKGGKP